MIVERGDAVTPPRIVWWPLYEMAAPFPHYSGWERAMNTRSRPRVLENNQFHRIGVVGEWVPISPNFLTKCVICGHRKTIYYVFVSPDRPIIFFRA